MSCNSEGGLLNLWMISISYTASASPTDLTEIPYPYSLNVQGEFILYLWNIRNQLFHGLNSLLRFLYLYL